ncbi:MAG: MMPL family transporter [Planctomycetota bacterium]|jgi:predicted exporter|nr:MMPL family transporter [Planctomycetota bacterium]
MQKRILRAIAAIACRRHGWVLWIALAITVASWLPPIISHFRGGLRASFDLAAMLPHDVPAARDFTRAIVDFDSADEAVVVFRLGRPDEREPSPRELAARPELGGGEARENRKQARARHAAAAGRVADALVERLQDDPRVRSAFCRRFRPEDKDYLFYEALPSYGLLLLGEGEVGRVRELLEPDSIRRSVASAKAKLAGVMSGALDLDEGLLMDAIGLGSVFQRALAGYGVASASGVQASGDYLVDRDATMLLAVIQPDRPAQSVDFALEISAAIREAASSLYAELVPPAARDSIQVEFGGGYEAAVSYTNHVNSNLVYTLVTSLIGVLAIFGLIFRRVGVLVYIGLPLVMVVSWTIGAGWLMYGQLNLISASFAAVLVALGIDYAIHIYNRYAGERAEGKSLEEAFAIALENTGWGVIIGMVTTAIGFLSLGATRFSQLVEFGVLAGTGIFLSAPVMLFVLPALFAWRGRGESGQPVPKPLKLGLDRLGRAIGRNPAPFVAASALLLAVGLWRLIFHYDSLVFDERLSSLRPPERVFELSGEIARAFSNRNPNGLMLLAYGGDEAQAVELAGRLQEVCAEMEKTPIRNSRGQETPLLVSHESFLRYLPPPSSQRRMLAMLREADLERALREFRQALDAEGLDEEYFGFTLALLERHRERAAADKAVLPTDLRDTPLWRYMRRFVSQRRRQIDLRDGIPADLAFPATLAAPALDRSGTVRAAAGETLGREALLALYHSPDLNWQDQVKRVSLVDPSAWAVKISVYPPPPAAGAAEPLVDDAWLAPARERLGAAAGGGETGGIVLAGMPILAHELAKIVKDDFRRVSAVVFGLCALVLLVFFIRHPWRTAWSLSPIALGLVYLVGFMSLAGVPFNFVNTLVIPIIVGLGVDNGIHLCERFFESGRDAAIIVSDTGRALIVTSLTSCAGFGSLAISGYDGVASMGRLFIVALGLVLFASLFSVPALLRTAYRREGGGEDRRSSSASEGGDKG